jgi:hypothetical protein
VTSGSILYGLHNQEILEAIFFSTIEVLRIYRYIYCHVLSHCRRGIGLTIGFIGSRYNYSYIVSQCTPFTTLQ